MKEDIGPGSMSMRSYFNRIRNNSSRIFSVLTWGQEDSSGSICRHHQHHIHHQHPDHQKQDITARTRPSSAGPIHIKWDDEGLRKSANTALTTAGTNADSMLVESDTKETIKSRDGVGGAGSGSRGGKGGEGGSKRKEEEEEKEGCQEDARKGRIEEYIRGMVPYTRTISDSRFQMLYGRPSMTTYGGRNIHPSSGGIIYGEYMKTFNVNPHAKSNQPKTYETYNTSLNFGKRSKLNQDLNLTRLERLLAKQIPSSLPKKIPNQQDRSSSPPLQPGTIRSINIDDSNKQEEFRKDRDFKFENWNDVREEAYNQKVAKNEQAKESFLERKREKLDLVEKALERVEQSSYRKKAPEGNFQPGMQFGPGRVTTFRYQDREGIVRSAVDRHGVTCYVDPNLEGNQEAYQQELISKNPILKQKIINEADRNIDPQRSANHHKEKQNVYFSHALLPKSQQPEVLKLLQGRLKETQLQSKSKDTKLQGNTGRSRNAEKGMSLRKSEKQGKQETRKEGGKSLLGRNNRNESDPSKLATLKMELLEKAWEDPSLAEKLMSNSELCCPPTFLPSHELNPSSYKSSRSTTARIPYAGFYLD